MVMAGQGMILVQHNPWPCSRRKWACCTCTVSPTGMGHMFSLLLPYLLPCFDRFPPNTPTDTTSTSAVGITREDNRRKACKTPAARAGIMPSMILILNQEALSGHYYIHFI